MEGLILWGISSLIPQAGRLFAKYRYFFDWKEDFDCIIVGGGLSGLYTAYELVHNHNVNANKLLILEAQSYLGGRVKQSTEFVPGMTIDLGAEIIHGSNTILNRIAEEIGEETSAVFVWAHGDGGPLDEPVNGGYGLYYLKDDNGDARLLRFDEDDKDFINTNNALHDLGEVDLRTISEKNSLCDYLKSKGIESSGLMGKMVSAGFSNTMCTNSEDMSLAGMVVWKRAWDMEDGIEADFRLKSTYKCLIDFFKKALWQVPIYLRHSVDKITYEQDALAGGKVHVEVRDNVDSSSGDDDKGWGRSRIVTAKCVVVTVPTSVLAEGRVTFSPPLSEEEKSSLYGNRTMFPAYKVLLSFRKRWWPAGLHGTIMAGEGVLVPEAWFREMDEKDIVDAKLDEMQPRCYVTGFLTAGYALELENAGKNAIKDSPAADLDHAMCEIFLNQLCDVFSLLESRHMTALPSQATSSEPDGAPCGLPFPRDVYCEGMVHRWNKEEHPFIGGGYSCGRAGAAPVSEEAHIVSVGKGNLFFAGEGTAVPGSTAHSALGTSIRAARQVSAVLQHNEEK